MAEFNAIEQNLMAKDLSPEQKLLFNSQLTSSMKDRNIVLILSVLFGYWGVDRFYVGDMGMGLLKLFTFGLCGILWLVDIFTIRGQVDKHNRAKAAEILTSIKMMGA